MAAHGKVVVVLPAFNAARTLERTIREIPAGSVDELLLVDDASSDETVAVAERLGIPTQRHPQNRGYGGNQKTCYAAALEMGADIVVMLHPDYQYDPGLIPMMVERLRAGDCEAVLGSRMLDGGARVGGMPWWKRLGNRMLTRFQNASLGTSLSEFHTGYRAFSRRALQQSGFERFRDGFVFDAQMLVALHYRGFRIVEIACPARYLPEASSVDLLGSIRYGLGCLAVSLRYRLNRLGLAPAGWLGGRDPMPLPAGAPTGLFVALCIWFLWSRFSTGALSHPPIRLPDSLTYSDPEGLLDLTSFVGSAPRTWPVPLFYSLFAGDAARILAQVVVGAWSWIGLAAAVAARLRHRAVALISIPVVLGLGLTSQAALWDSLIMAESLAITASIVTLTLALHHLRRPTWLSGISLGLVAGLLLLVRPLMAPIGVALGLAELLAYLRGRRTRMVALTVALPILAGIVWLGFLSPRQDHAYAVFEREVRNYPSARYVSDTWASVFYERIIGDPQARAWLAANDAPPFVPLMQPPRFVDDKEGWWQFRYAYASSEGWKRWFDAGGASLTLRLLAASPRAHVERFLADLPLIINSGWGDPVFADYGPEGAVSPVAWPFFRAIGPIPSDLLALGVVFTSLAIIARRRRQARSPSHGLVWMGIASVFVSAYYIGAAWLLVGVEFVRHTVPGPLGLRLGALLLVLGMADTVFTNSPRAQRDPDHPVGAAGLEPATSAL